MNKITLKEIDNFKGTAKQIAEFLAGHGATVETIEKNKRFETGRQTDAFVQNRYYKSVKVFVVRVGTKMIECNDLQQLRFAASNVVRGNI